MALDHALVSLATRFSQPGLVRVHRDIPVGDLVFDQLVRDLRFDLQAGGFAPVQGSDQEVSWGELLDAHAAFHDRDGGRPAAPRIGDVSSGAVDTFRAELLVPVFVGRGEDVRQCDVLVLVVGLLAMPAVRTVTLVDRSRGGLSSGVFSARQAGSGRGRQRSAVRCPAAVAMGGGRPEWEPPPGELPAWTGRSSRSLLRGRTAPARPVEGSWSSRLVAGSFPAR